MELNKVHHSQLPLTCLDKAVIRVMIKPSLMDGIVPSNEGGGQAVPGSCRHQSLSVFSVDGVRHPVVEPEDPPGTESSGRCGDGESLLTRWEC